jgi:SecD/SecF fusion protein
MGRSIRQESHLDNDSARMPRTEKDGTIKYLMPVVKDGKIQFLIPEGDPSQLWHTLAVARGEENLVDTRTDEKGRPVRVYEKAWKDGETPDPAKFQKYQAVPFQGSSLLYSRMVGNPSLLKPEDRDKKVEYFLLVRNAQQGKEVTGQYLTSAYRTTSNKNMGPAVGFHFNPTGGDRFHDLTSLNAPARGFHRQLAIVLDGQIVTAPSLNAVISSEGIIEGKFSGAEVDRYVNILNSGALPASLKQQPVSENTIGATLGQETINKGSLSVCVAFGAVLLFMLIYYRFSGLVACIALLANLLLTVAFMVLVQATFTLPGLAGLVLMLGMAVDANVLIYERLREERDRGATLALAIRNGYDRAFPIIIDTHLSSIFTAIVLYAVGNDQLKGFGISLTVGLIISLFTSLVMTRLMFDICLHLGWLKKLSMFRLLSRTNIDFMAIRYYWFTATIVLTILGATVFFYRLDKGGLNIDFVGGTAYTGQLTKAMNLTELRQALGAPPYEPHQKEVLAVKSVKQLDERGMAFEITYDDDSKRRVDLPNPAVEPPDRARAELAVKARASELPDLSVEQMFLSSDTEAASKGSSLFTVRTSEKAPELVQASIGRLLVDNLLQIGLKSQEGGALWINPAGAVVNLEFTDATTHEPTAVALDKVRPLMEGALVKAPALEGVGAPQEGRYQRVALTFQEDTSQAALDKAISAVQAGLKTQPGDHPVQVASSFTQAKLEFINLSLLKAEPDIQKTDPKALGAYASPGQVRMLLDRELQALSLSTRQFTLDGEGAQQDGRYKTMDLKLTEPLDRDTLSQVLERTESEFSQRPQPERLENFDSQLASETRSRALYAILASWAAILLYLWFRFGNWTFGAAAVLCLIHDLFFTLGIIAFCHFLHGTWIGNLLLLEDFKIDLPAVAALLTLVGYSVNDTIVVFDRIREVRGKNPDLTPKMINDSVNQTLSRTLLTATTVFLVVIVLYIFGGEGIHLFGFVMVVGVIVGTYSSIYIASPLLLIFGEGTHRAAPVREPVPAGAR